MRSRKVTRWYCDFCKKATMQEPSMVRHEKGCTANPNRECWICVGDAQLAAAPLSELIEFCRKNCNGEQTLSAEHVAELKKIADGCPACMTAAIRQAKVYAVDFDMKKEFDNFHRERKRIEHEELLSIVGSVC